MKEINVRVTGRVQLVMFRDFAQRMARNLRIRGTVQNLKDGSVCIVAQGNEETLTRYIELLHKGPLLSNVEGVSTRWVEPSEQFTGFSIL